MYLYAWTVSIAIIYTLIVVVLWIVYRVLFKKRYVIANPWTGYGVVEDGSIKKPEFVEPKDTNARVNPL